MDIDLEILNAVRDGIRAGVKDKFAFGYNSPLDKLVSASLEKHHPAFRSLLEDAIASCINDPTFRKEIESATRTVIAKTLVQKFGGEMEKQVNALKSDPTTRARITLAIEEIVKSKPA